MKQRLIIFLMLVLALGGCSTVVDYSGIPNNVLIAQGLDEIERGKYSRAARSFRQVILNADNPANAQFAQRRMGDAYFLDGKFTDAIAAYEIYYELYRQAEDLPYVIYMLGVSYSNIARTSSRDTTSTHKAVDYFDELEARFPDRYYEFKADAHRSEMRNRLAINEYKVARYYSRTGHRPQAVTRLLFLLETYPDTPTAENARVMLVRTYTRMGALPEAREALGTLKELHPDNTKISRLERNLVREEQRND